MASRFAHTQDGLGFGGGWIAWLLRRLERDLVDAEVELVALGDINGDGETDYSISLTRVVEYTFNGFFGRSYSWEREFDRDFVVLSGEDGPKVRDLNRATGIEGDIIETRSLGDINGDGFDDFASLTEGGGFYGLTELPSNLVGDDIRGFQREVVGEVYVTFGGQQQQAQSLADAYEVDGRVVNVEALGDINGDGFDDFSVSTGGYYGYYGTEIDEFAQVAYYGRMIDETFLVLGGRDQNDPIGLNQFGLGKTVLSVSDIGDVNGDGITDLGAVTGGFFGLDESGGFAGEVRSDVVVLLGNDGGGFQDPISLTRQIGQDTRALDIDAFDINGDGISDLAVEVGNYYGERIGPNPGEVAYYGLEINDVFLFLGGRQGAPVSLGELAGAGRTAIAAYDLGDINGDGFGDIGIGVAGYYGYYGSDPDLPTGGYYGYYGDSVDDVLVIFGNPAGRLVPTNLNDFVGTQEELHGAVNVGDLNADGFDDLVVACGYYGEGLPGDQLVVLGGRAAAQQTVMLNELGLSDNLFGRVEALGDTNGDGFADFSVAGYYGASAGEYYGEVLNGSAYVIYGGEAALTVSAFAQNGRLAGGNTVARIDLDVSTPGPDVPGASDDPIF